MNKNLEWIARNGGPIPAEATCGQFDDDEDGINEVDWFESGPASSFYGAGQIIFNIDEIEAARRKLGLDKTLDDCTPSELTAASRAARMEVTEEEDRAWQEKERKMTPGEVAEGMINGTVTWDDGAVADNINHPPHYQLRPGYEVYDLRQDLAKKAAQAGISYAQFSDWDRALEYQLRCWQKNGLEDLQKARWYLDQLIQKVESES